MELPALIWLLPAHIVEAVKRDVPLIELIRSGAELVVGESKPFPETTLVRMTDSQEALALALGDDALTYYRVLGKKY